MLTSRPSRLTWMWPSSGLIGPLVCCAGTTVPPMRLTTSVMSGGVTWLGVGCTIWTRVTESGWAAVDVDDDFAPPHPVRVTAKASTAGSARRVTFALIVDAFLQGRNASTATRPE